MTGRRRPVVAIDGPAGAGKTTVTRGVARELGYVLVGTGALYRGVALAASRHGLGWEDERAVAALARRLAQTGALRLEHGGGAERVWLEGEDVTDAIRDEGVGTGASRVSAHSQVRAALLELQRQAGREGGVVLEGRDIGTAVFPDAEAKFFLTASARVRADRRWRELQARGVEVDRSEVLREVEARDRRDSSREVAPLRQADDAVYIDSSELSVGEVVARIVEHVRRVEARLARTR